MSAIRQAIKKRNKNNQKALSVFLTCGYPDLNSFGDLATDLVSAGADMLELGIPFSDPIADGPVIQASSQQALEKGVSVKTVLNLTAQIKGQINKPLILMGYANPLIQYGLKNFLKDAQNSGVDGLIVPDVPLDEYQSFWAIPAGGLDIILLTTPTSTETRIRKIDDLSSGFVYCVSVTGTTGARDSFDESVIKSVAHTYDLVSKNKMLIGFGISGADDIKRFKPCCDGVIVGSAVIRHLNADNPDPRSAMNLISGLRTACDQEP